MKGKKRYIIGSKEEQEKLYLGWKKGKTRSYRDRCHYILLSMKGKSVPEISEIYEVTYQTVLKWFNKYEKEGISSLMRKTGSGRCPILRIDNKIEVEKIEEFVEKNAQNLKPVINQIKEHLGKEVSKRTLQRFLKKKVGVGSVLER